LRSVPWESAGEAGWEKQFEVEELFPACPLFSPVLHGLEFLVIGENFRGEFIQVSLWIVSCNEEKCFPLV
jgi:hypothetical protein